MIVRLPVDVVLVIDSGAPSEPVIVAGAERVPNESEPLVTPPANESGLAEASRMMTVPVDVPARSIALVQA